MITDTLGYVHGTGSSVQGPITVAAAATISAQPIYGDALCASGSQYSNLELDLGAPGFGATWPYTQQFPSYTEVGYTYPPETFDTPIQWGLNIQIMSAFNTLASILFYLCSSATTAALYSVAPIGQRTLTLAQMQVVGATYFISVNSLASVLEFNRFYAAITGSNPTLGTIVAWYGPKTGGVL